MSKLNDVRNKFTEVQIGEDTYKLKFDMNAFAELEEMYGDINTAMTALSKGSVKGIMNVLYAGLLSHHPNITVKEIGSLLDLSQVEEITKTLEAALSSSIPQVKEEDKKSTKKDVVEKK